MRLHVRDQVSGLQTEWIIDRGLVVVSSCGIFQQVEWEGETNDPGVLFRNIWWMISAGILADNAVFFFRVNDSVCTFLQHLSVFEGYFRTEDGWDCFRLCPHRERVAKKKPVIVSAIYDIRQMEGQVDHDTKRLDLYLKHGEWWKDTDHDIPVVVFTSSSLREKIGAIFDGRPNTHIIIQEFHDTQYYEYMELIAERQKTYHILNRHPDKDTPAYILLMCNKMHFLETALSIHGSATHAVWVDFGIRHVADNVAWMHSWIRLIPDKIRIMAVSPWDRMYPPDGVSTREHDRRLHTYWYHFVAGGLFSGSRNHIIWLAKKFEEYFRRILITEEYYQNDQVILAMLARNYSDHFSFYFGDYSSIIENYWFPYGTMWLIELHAQRYTEQLPTHNPMMDHLVAYTESFLQHHPVYSEYYQRIASVVADEEPPEVDTGYKITQTTKKNVQEFGAYFIQDILPEWIGSDTNTPMLICRNGNGGVCIRWLNREAHVNGDILRG